MIRIKELRKQKNLSLVELGKKVGMSDSRLSQYETGRREPNIATLIKLANYFHVSIDYLAGRDVNFNDMTVNINKSWDYKDAKMHFQPCKNKFSNRILVIDPLAAADLKQVMSGCPKDDPIFVRALSNERTKGKYHDDYGNKYARIYDCTLNRQLYRYCKKAGVPRITIHSLRHIHGSLLISHGVSIESVSKRLGHANTITTQKTYIHLLEDLKTKDDHKMIRILSELEGQPEQINRNSQEAQSA